MPGRSRRIEVLCPECSARNPFVQWEIVDAAENPPLLNRILDGTLFDFTCRNCQQTITLDFGVRLEDHGRRLIINYDAPRDPQPALPDPPSPEYRLRRVTDQNAFIELVRIGKDSLDDSVMLLIKHLLARDVEQQTGVRPLVCSYDAISNAGGVHSLEFIVWMPEEEEPRLYSVPLTAYDELKAAVSQEAEAVLPDGQWVDWSAAAAQQLVLNLKPSRTAR